MALRIVVQFVVRFEVRSVQRMCIILYRMHRNFRGFRGVLLTSNRSTCAMPTFKLRNTDQLPIIAEPLKRLTV